MTPTGEPAPAVLVVEDDPNLRRSLALILGSEGYRVAVAEDGEAGLKLALGGGWACILTDTMMPRMDGLEMLRRLVETGTDIPPVLLVSAAYTLPGAEDLRALHIRQVIPKPFAVGHLLDTVMKVIGERAGGGSEAPVNPR